MNIDAKILGIQRIGTQQYVIDKMNAEKDSREQYWFDKAEKMTPRQLYPYYEKQMKMRLAYAKKHGYTKQAKQITDNLTAAKKLYGIKKRPVKVKPRATKLKAPKVSNSILARMARKLR